MPPKRSDLVYQAQAILSRRDHAAAEVERKLRRKGFSAGQIAQAIDWLTSRGLLDDRAFALAYAQSILKTKPVGRRWLAARLWGKGVARAIVADALDQVFEGEQEIALARAAVGHWRRRHQAQGNDRLYRFLVARGFSREAIERTLEI